MRFISKWELNDDTVSSGIGVGLVDFANDIGVVLCKIVFDGNADVGAVFDFIFDIFHNDGIVTIADDKEFWVFMETANLMSLSLFDKTC